MPIYNYQCFSCKSIFENFGLSISSMKENLACPKCGSNLVKRIISESSFILKGEGWDNGTQQKQEKEKNK